MVSDETDFRSVNGNLDLRFNQSIDWFLNSTYYTVDAQLNFLFVNEANQIETNELPWLEGRRFKFSQGNYRLGDKVILYYANEIYFNFSAGEQNTLECEYNFINDIIQAYSIPRKDILLIGNIYEHDNSFSKLASMLQCNLLLIDYYELQTFFFHSVLGCNHNKSFNKHATKDLKYLFGKVDKPIRIIMMHELWLKGLLNNSVTGCLIDKSDIKKLATDTVKEYLVWYKKNINIQSVEKMLNTHYGSPDNVPYFYFTLSEKRKQKLERSVDVINHCPSYPYNFEKLFTDVKMSIIPETFYYQNQAIFLTEKTYKVIYNHHPFTILGNQGILKTLRARGYQTFNTICDELYDECRNDRKRLDLVINATEQLIASTNYLELKRITDYNFNQLEKNAHTTISHLNSAIQTLISA